MKINEMSLFRYIKQKSRTKARNRGFIVDSIIPSDSSENGNEKVINKLT
jgi:hypothetical protein